MPGCILRVHGCDSDLLDVDAFLRDSKLPTCAVWRKGEDRGRGPSADSGFNAVVSESSGHELQSQIQDAVRYLERWRQQLAQLRGAPGLELIVLDFGINRRDVPVQRDRFAVDLIISLAAELGMCIQLTLYP
jgi:hypothetical protein